MTNQQSKKHQLHQLSTTMTQVFKLIICEQSERWGNLFLHELQQQNSCGGSMPDDWEHETIRVTNLVNMATHINRFPASFVLAEATTQHYRELVVRLPRWRKDFAHLKVVVVCFDLPRLTPNEAKLFEAVFQESGATGVVSSVHQLFQWAPYVVQHFAKFPTPPETNISDAIQKRLPWQTAKSNID